MTRMAYSVSKEETSPPIHLPLSPFFIPTTRAHSNFYLLPTHPPPRHVYRAVGLAELLAKRPPVPSSAGARPARPDAPPILLRRRAPTPIPFSSAGAPPPPFLLPQSAGVAQDDGCVMLDLGASELEPWPPPPPAPASPPAPVGDSRREEGRRSSSIRAWLTRW
jgi:hypothetical protein